VINAAIIKRLNRDVILISKCFNTNILPK